MGIGKIALKAVKSMFRKPNREGAKLYESLPFAFGVGYSGLNMYKAMKNIKNNKDLESKKDIMEAYVGMAVTAGSIFGIGGALLAGGGIKLLCESSKGNINIA